MRVLFIVPALLVCVSCDQAGGADAEAARESSSEPVEQSIAGADFPPGFSLYPKSKFVSGTSTQGEDGLEIRIEIESGASTKELISYYRKQAEAAGVKIEMETDNGDSAMVGGWTASKDFVSFVARDDGEMRTGVLLYGKYAGR